MDQTVSSPRPPSAVANLAPAGQPNPGAATGERTRAGTVAGAWHRWAFGAVLALAAVLNIANLDKLGYGNTYYAAAVKSMLQSWHNFFFVSFDPGGFVSVDKPPLGFWIQTASAWLFGFSGLSILLPEAIAGVLSVALLGWLVRRAFGPVAGLLAALALAVTPIAVAVNRNNTIDSLLIVLLLGAAWAVTRAIEGGGLRWLLLGALLIGLGFNVKMLQAYLVVPAFFLAYLLGARLRWPARFGHLALAGALVLVVSFSWAAIVDHTPADQRPYVGSSQTNSVVNLVLGYNGLDRALPSGWLRDTLLGQSGGGAFASNPVGNGGFGAFETGTPGPLRLFDTQLAGQIAWMLPLAALGLIAAWWQERTRWPLGRRHAALVLWGGWFLTAAVFFSFANMFHRYYLAMLAPPAAALVGVGLVALWRDYRSESRRGWLLPLTIAATAAVQARILTDYPDWAARLTPLVLGLGAVAAIGLVALRWSPGGGLPAATPRVRRALAAAGLVALLTAPAVWAGYSTVEGDSSGLPAAGPAGPAGSGFLGFGARGGDGANDPSAIPAASTGASSLSQPVGVGTSATAGGSGGAPQGAFGPGGEADPKLIAFLLANRGQTRFMLATTSAMGASPYILATGQPVAALGGFIGGDPILTADQLAAKVASGEMRFFLVPSEEQAAEMAAMMPGPTQQGAAGPQRSDPSGRGGGPGFLSSATTEWVNGHCTPVPAKQWQSTPTTTDNRGPMGGGMQTLYDCAGAA